MRVTLDQGCNGGGEKQLDLEGSSNVKAKNIEATKELSHLQRLHGPGIESRYSDSKAQSSLAVRYYIP